MKKNMLYLFIALAAVLVAAFAARGFKRPVEVTADDDQGHVLTALWKNYYAAEKADLPKKMSEALDAIKKEAKARRYHWDFYDAALKKVNAEVSRNWKVRGEMMSALAKEIEEYDEPIVTYAYKSSHGGGNLSDYVLTNKTRLQAGRNKALYSAGIKGQMNGLLGDFIKDDYEYALWSERVRGGANVKAAGALKEYLGDTYPNAAWLECMKLQNMYWSGRKGEVEAFVAKYKGKAINLFGKSMLFDDKMSQLSREKAGEDAYKALYAEIKAAERERLTYKTGVDGKIAGTIDDFKDLTRSLEEKSISLTVEEKEIIITLRNLDKVEVSMVTDAKDPVTLFKKTVLNPKKSFFVWDTVRVDIPRRDDGEYIIKAKNGKIEAEGNYISKTLSIAVREDAEGRKFYVTDYLTGEPLKAVDLKLSLSGKVVAGASGVAIDGFTPLPANIEKAVKEDANHYLEASWRDPEGFLRKSKELSLWSRADFSPSTPSVSVLGNIFTDKGAYNPGETVKFKAVVYKGNRLTSFETIGAGEEVEARLVNTEGKEVASTKLTTNEFGSVAGEFKIPEGERNGRFTLSIRRGTKDIESRSLVVDEFVLPTFDLSFESVDSLYFVGDEVEVKGKVSSYSGHPLDAAEVSYTVDSWGTRIQEGEVELASDGSFAVKFTSVPDRYWYTVTVKVKDATGETDEYSRNVFVLDRFSVYAAIENTSEGNVTLSGERYSSCELLSGDKARVTFSARNNDGQLVPLTIKYQLIDSKEVVVESGEAKSGETKEIAVPKPGLYTISLVSEVTTPKGKEISAKDKTRFLMVGDSDNVIHADVENFFKLVGPCADGSLKDGEDIQVQVGAGAGPVWMVAEFFGDLGQPLGRRLVHLEGKEGKAGSIETVTFNYKSDYPDAVRVCFFYFRKGAQYTFGKEFRREKHELDLPLAFSSFEDKAYPGKEYSFTLKSAPGTEIVAAVFDKSSERIAPNRWQVVRLVDVGARNIYYDALVGGIDRWGDRRGGLRMSKSRGVYAEEAVAYASVPMVSDAIDIVEEDVAVEDNYMSREDAGNGAKKEAVEESLDDVSVRSDFSTALAFEPFLRTGADGEATLRFTTSDKLSTFIVQVYAHDKKMKNALLRQEMVVSIPLKVSVMEPKYLYKGDKYTLHATVSSLSDKPVSGTVALQTYAGADHEGSKPIATLSKKITVPAGESVPVEFAVDPKGNDLIGLKVVFADDAKTFSDAAFVTVPVYDAEQTLTEAHSAVLLAGMDKEALIARLRSSFTGTSSAGAEYKEIDIRQMLLDAIPTKVEPSGKDILSLTEAYYVRLVAGKLGADIKLEMPDEELVKKIVACQNADGGFGWFEGMKSSPVITAVVLERLAKLRDAGLGEGICDPAKAVTYLDRNQFIHSEWPYWCGWLSTPQYVYVRSMYASVPFDVSRETVSEKSEYSKNFKDFKKYIKDYLIPSAKDGRGLQGQILSKARRIKTLVNMVYGEGGLDLASAWGVKFSAESKMRSSIIADVASLDEYAVEHRDGGWYYPNAVMPWRGLLESELYAHSLLCDLLSDKRIDSGLAQEAKIADGIRIWIMLQKETQKWADDPAYVDAINSVLTGGEDVLSTRVILMTKTYREPFSKIVSAGNGFTIERRFFKEVLGENSSKNLLEIFPGMKLKTGDKVIAEYRIWNQENRSFVKLTAPREAAFRPVNQLSGHVGWWYRPIGSYAVSPQGYRNVKADRTEYFFDVYPEENTTVSEEFYITQEGVFTAPVVTIESLYAPHYRANDKFGGALQVIE